MTAGKQKADFPGAFIPFDKSVGPVPAVSIDSAPTVQLCVNEDWLPYIVTCLKALARPETWDGTYDNSVRAASEFAALVANTQDGCGVVVPAKMCVSGTFEDFDYGFVPDPGGACAPTWTAGVGWEMCADATPQGFLQIKREFGGTTLIREFHLHMHTNFPYLVNIDVVLFDSPDFVNIYSNHAVTGPTIDINVTGLAQSASAIFISVVETLGGAAADTKFTTWGLCYTGLFPLSTVGGGWSESFNVSSLGTTINTAHSTSTSKNYRVTLSGTIITGSTHTPVIVADGVFVTLDGGSSWQETCVTYSGGFELDGSLSIFCGHAFVPAHVYEAIVPGTGTTFGFKFQDSDYADNSGSLQVTVQEL